MYHKAPFMGLCLALIAGILCELLLPGVIPPALTAGSAAALFLIHLYATRQPPDLTQRLRWAFGGAALLLVFAIGQRRLAAERLPPPALTGEWETLNVQLEDSPVEKSKTVRAQALASDTDGRRHRLLLYVAKDSASLALKRGDRLLIRVKEREQDFSYYTSRDIFRQGYVSDGNWRLTGGYPSFHPVRLASEIRNALLQRLRAYLAPEAFPLAAALTLGYKREVSRETQDAFADAGTSHLLAVSGLHIGFIYAALRLLFGWKTRKRWLRILQCAGLTAGLWAYVFLCGLPASAIRSGIMFTLIGIADLTRSKGTTLNSLFSAAFLMLIVRPFYLFDIGFQLSFSAVLGIVTLNTTLRSLLPETGGIAGKLTDMMTVSTAAQLGTLPVTLYCFRQFPTYFLLSNLWAIPLATLLVYGTLAVMAGGGVPVAGPLACRIVEYGFAALTYGMEWIGNLPAALLHLASFSLADACCTALLIASGRVYAQNRKTAWLYSLLGCVIFLLCSGIAKDFRGILPTFAEG